MDCDITNQFEQMTMSSNDHEIFEDKVYLEKPEKNVKTNKFDPNFSDERLNQVKQRLKARQAERKKNATVTTAKLISIDEAIRLYSEEKKQTEVRFILSIRINSRFYIGTFNSTNYLSIIGKYVPF